MRISDWSSDVCSSDLATVQQDRQYADQRDRQQDSAKRGGPGPRRQRDRRNDEQLLKRFDRGTLGQDRKSVVYGKIVSVRVDIGGRRNIKKTDTTIEPFKRT